MRIYKSLRSLISKTTQNQRKTTRTFLTVGPTGSIQTQNHHPHLHTKWGPLFRFFPPCNLTRSSSTPTGHKAPVLGLNLEGLALVKGDHDKEVGSGSGRIVAGRVKEEEKGVEDDGVVRSYLNLPNFISLARLFSGPFIGWMITNEMYTGAFVGLGISGATDWLDGYVARKMKIDSVVGSYLDPLADKVLIGSVALAMVHQNLLHPGLVGLVVLRDVALVGGALYHRASSLHWKWNSWYDFVNLDGTQPEKVEPLFISKVNTVLQLVLVATALLQPEFGTPETEPCITYLSWMVAATTTVSTAAYGAKYMGNRSLLLPKKS